MTSNSEQMILLKLISSDINQNNQMKKYFDIDINLEMIRQLDSTKPVAFQITDSSTSNEVVELLLTHSALKSLQDVSHQSRSSIESKREEIISLLNNSNLFCDEKDIPSNDYIEWALTSENLMIKCKKFREQIDVYNTYDVRHPSITMQIVEIIQYYIKEYLVREENFSHNYINKLEECFQDAIRKQNYFLYFIKAYTMTGNFHCVLNKHLALYIIDYFDPSTYISQPGKYRLINCLVHITALVFNYPGIHQYHYEGITYRGLVINENDLEYYTIGNYILNRSFISTSKDRSVATLFSGFEQENIFNETSQDYNSTKVSVLFKYKIEPNTTGLDIERISSIEDEKEVIILPFSVFQVKHRKEIYSKKCSHILLHEIHLEECRNNQIQQDQLSTNYQRSRNKCKDRTMFSSQRLKSNIKWKQHATTIAGGNGDGDKLDQLYYPYAIYVDNLQQSIYIADCLNYRIVRWKLGENIGQIIAGGNGKGNRIDQLNTPSDVIVDQKNKSLIICDCGNRRVVRWSLENQQDKQIIIQDIYCLGLMMNDNGDLFVSDVEKHEVKRWRKGEKEGTIVAGGNGKGNQFIQLDWPASIFIDRQETVYVSDNNNHRVMKWMKNAKEGIVVAGGYGEGNSSRQLYGPRGLIVNEVGDVYVADSLNNRVMCWFSGSKVGHVIVGGNGEGQGSNQFKWPGDLSFDIENNLYVVDKDNHRIQRFDVDEI